ncbi:polyphosphate polymerase domain-containing protein [Nocardiopsis sp. HNM0947]|uniref:Polyphosphate polymerase domain-containing protein n=1 Tax=Nocardiopsis coralli TaxID=2772213 RepID=A0ABR9P2X3_9ACTN|nr:polyphosphate polymerase domain-containing protein [Nocardiopsis coralli]MBE2998196.1 polyphosphate polymerase domain-containing protein [Nocardiopsis coralli]
MNTGLLGDLSPTPLSLDEINTHASLVTRVCRKYLVPADALPAVLAENGEEIGVLTIGGADSFRYSSTYFDTPDLRSFRDHRQGRRRRYKARVRSYVDTDTRLFEVKLKGVRGLTDKVRVDHDGPTHVLPRASRAFLDTTLGGYGLGVPETVAPTAVTDYRRTTLVTLSGTERLTLDTELVGRRGGREVRMRPGVVLLEVKTRGGLTSTERRLHAHGFREVSFSKYAATVAALEPRMRGNRWGRAAASCLEPAGPIERTPSACFT